MPLLVVFFLELFLSDNQSTQAFTGEIIAFVLDVAAVDWFALFDHNHVCAFEVQDYSVCVKVFNDDAHAFCFARKWEICQDFVLFFSVVWIENENFVLLSVSHQEAQLLSKLYQSDLVGT